MSKKLKPELYIQPLLAEGTHGKGKVLVCLGTPMEELPTGTEAYWKSESWKKFMKKIIKNILPEIK